MRQADDPALFARWGDGRRRGVASAEPSSVRLRHLLTFSAMAVFRDTLSSAAVLEPVWRPFVADATRDCADHGPRNLEARASA